MPEIVPTTTQNIVEQLDFPKVSGLLQALGFKYAFCSRRRKDEVTTLVFEVDNNSMFIQQVTSKNVAVPVFEWEGETLSIFSLLNHLFQKLPASRQQELMNKHYDPGFQWKDFSSDFLSFLRKSSFLTTQQVILDEIPIHNIRLKYHSPEYLEFLFDCSNKHQDCEVTFLPFDTSIAVFKSDDLPFLFFRECISPLRNLETVKEMYPGLSLSDFLPTGDIVAQNNYRVLLYTIFLKTYTDSKSYKLRASFNTKHLIHQEIFNLFHSFKAKQTFL